MQYALDHKIPSIIIYHDYQGIASWCNGDWKANKAGTIAYRDFIVRRKNGFTLNFEKSKDILMISTMIWSMNLQKKHLESIDKICQKTYTITVSGMTGAKLFEEDTIMKNNSSIKTVVAVGIGAALFFVLGRLLQYRARYRTQISVFSMQYLHFWLLCMDRLQAD